MLQASKRCTAIVLYGKAALIWINQAFNHILHDAEGRQQASNFCGLVVMHRLKRACSDANTLSSLYENLDIS